MLPRVRARVVLEQPRLLPVPHRQDKTERVTVIGRNFRREKVFVVGFYTVSEGHFR